MTETTHLIGLLLGTEEDWPRAFETLLARLGPITDASGHRHRIATEFGGELLQGLLACRLGQGRLARLRLRRPHVIAAVAAHDTALLADRGAINLVGGRAIRTMDQHGAFAG